MLAEEQGFEVRQATGVPIESSLPFGALSTLLAPDRRDQSLEQRAPALAAALGLGSMPDPPTVMAAASEALEVLSVRGRERPILLVLDDAQWADQSTATVMGHIARHVVADPLAVLVAWRDTPELRNPALPSAEAALTDFGNVRASVYDGVEAIELSPLTLAASRNALVAAGFSGADADRWALRCGGLPLAVAVVARLASFASPTPSDVAAVLPAAYLERIAALPAEVADAALCVAVCGDLGVLRALGIPRLFRRSSSAGCVPWLDSSRRRWVASTRPCRSTARR